MQEDILSVLEKRMPEFSKGQRRIAAYIIENCDKAAFMTASCLGEIANVSESTVVRFAMELEYEGYPGLQKALQETVLNRLNGLPQRKDDLYLDGKDPISECLQSDCERLCHTADTLNRDDFFAAVDAILQGNHIYIIGARASAVLANYMGYYLKFLFSNVHILTSSGEEELLEQLINVEQGDTIVAFSFQRDAAVIKGIKYCQRVGAKTVVMTNSYSEPLAKCADLVLVAQSAGTSFADSLVAPMGVVNVLLTQISSGRGAVLKKNRDTLERVLELHHHYEAEVDEQ